MYPTRTLQTPRCPTHEKTHETAFTLAKNPFFNPRLGKTLILTTNN